MRSKTPTPIPERPDDDATKRAHVHQMWASVAPSWGEHADYTDVRHADVTARMLELVSPQPGERVLELACGAGGLGIAAAPIVGPDGTVVLSDVAAGMVEIASRRAEALGFTNTQTRILDLEDIDEADASLDVVLCRDGLQFAVDPAQATREIARVLRPGGRAALAVWGPREQNPWLGTVLDVTGAQFGRPMPPPGMPGPFALSDAGQLARIVSGAGFEEVALTRLSVPMRAASFDEWWNRTLALAGPVSAVVAGLSDGEAAQLRARAEAAVAPYRTPEGLAFEGLGLVVSARRSG